MNAQLRSARAEQAKLNATLAKAENAEVLERSLFLNTLIDRKAISWTKILAILKKVMPYNVRRSRCGCRKLIRKIRRCWTWKPDRRKCSRSWNR